jgi:hypothetical protein
MIYRRTLQRESDSSNRTITIEYGPPPSKYMVVVSGAGPDIQYFPFDDQYQSIQCAQHKLADSMADGYKVA